MKKLLIILLCAIAIKSQAQTGISNLTLTDSTPTSTIFSLGNNKSIVSKDTLFNDTTGVIFFVVDTTAELDQSYCESYFVRGYRVDVRQGEWYKTTQLYTPPGSENYLVAYFRMVDVKPPVIASYYLTRRKSRVLESFYIQEFNGTFSIQPKLH